MVVPGVARPVLVSPVQERCGCTRESPANGHDEGQGTGALLFRRKAERAVILCQEVIRIFPRSLALCSAYLKLCSVPGNLQIRYISE